MVLCKISTSGGCGYTHNDYTPTVGATTTQEDIMPATHPLYAAMSTDDLAVTVIHLRNRRDAFPFGSRSASRLHAEVRKVERELRRRREARS